MIYNISIKKRGIGIESEKVCKASWRSKKYGNKLEIKKIWKQVKDGAQGIIIIRRMKINSKAFAIPILTALCSTIINLMQFVFQIENFYYHLVCLVFCAHIVGSMFVL